MINVLPFRFQQCLSPFTMLFLQGYSEAVLSWHLSNRVFGRPYIWESISYECHLFFGICSKFNLDFQNAERNSEKIFCFWDKCIWIRCRKYSLSRREYLSWAVNVLTSALKILHITKSDFCKLNCVHSNQ